VDKDAFFKGSVEVDPEEVVMVFNRSPIYAEVVEKVRVELKLNDPSDVVKLEGSHNVGLEMHIR
jgi:glutamine amidotransferase PdxT